MTLAEFTHRHPPRAVAPGRPSTCRVQLDPAVNGPRAARPQLHGPGSRSQPTRPSVILVQPGSTLLLGSGPYCSVHQDCRPGVQQRNEMSRFPNNVMENY